MSLQYARLNQGRRGIRDREKGFIDTLASRAGVGCRPSPITSAAELEAGVREIEDDVWGLLRSGTPEQIAGLIRDMVLDGGFTSLVFLDVVAATAMNGALN